MMRSCGIKLFAHLYWNSKQAFALSKDRYPYWTLFAMEKGEFEYKIGEQRGIAAENDLILCPPQVWFHRRALKPVTFHYVQFEWLAGEENVDYPLEEVRVRITDKLRLSTSFAHLRQLSEFMDERSQCWKAYMVEDMLNMAVMERERTARLPKPTGDTLMLAVRKALQEQALEALQLGELASAFGMSPVQLTRRFRASFGVTPSQFITDIRLTRAVLLLKETALTMDEIAQRCGYDNGYYFSRVFEKNQQVRPSVYRKLNQV